MELSAVCLRLRNNGRHNNGKLKTRKETLQGVRHKHNSASHPVAPDVFIRPDHYLVSAADERKPEDHRLLGEPRQPALVRHLRVAQSKLVEPPGRLVDERHHSEFLRESSQLTD